MQALHILKSAQLAVNTSASLKVWVPTVDISQYGSLQYHLKVEYDLHWRRCMPPDAVS